MISFELEAEQTLIQETIHAFAFDELQKLARKAERDGVPDALRHAYEELGFRYIDLPETHGGAGANMRTAVIADEELGWGDVALAVALDVGYAGALFLSLVGEAKSGTTAIAYCEPKGSPSAFLTTARRSGDGFVLTGRKAWVEDALHATRFVVLAQLEGTSDVSGVAAFIVDRGAQKDGALRVGGAQQHVGLAARRVHEVAFEGCTAGAPLVAGDALIEAMRDVLARVGLRNAARQVGLARAAYELSLEYTQDRKAFGKAVAHFQANAFSLADMATDVDAARWVVWRAAVALDKVQADAMRLVADAVVHANDVAWHAADRGVQLLGGAGFVQDFLAEKRLRDTKALALSGAPTEWWRLDAASHHLGHPIDGPLPSASLQPFVL